jgi:hypothetical protein
MRNKDGTIDPEVAWANAWSQHIKAISETVKQFETKEELYNWMDPHELWKQWNRDEVFAIWSEHNNKREQND